MEARKLSATEGIVRGVQENGAGEVWSLDGKQ